MVLAERPVRALRFTGLGLGVWRWPLINILLEAMETRGVRSAIRGVASSSGPKMTYANIEEYSIWEDRSGVIRVRVHRKAERG